jgi:hypothetical protein
VFIDVNDVFQNIQGNITLNYVSPFPSANQFTPGQTFNMLWGTATVQTGGILWTANSAPIAPPGNNYNLTFCATDNTGQTCCTFNVTFNNDPNCTDGSNGGGRICTNNTIPGNAGVVTPGQVVQGATAFTSTLTNIVAGQTGNINITGVSTTAINFECTGGGTASLTPTMADGSAACSVTINCDSGNGNNGDCTNATIPGSAGQVAPGQVQNGATAFTSTLADIVAGQTGNIQITGVTPTQISFICTGGGTATITPTMADGSTDCTITIDCDDDGGNNGGGNNGNPNCRDTCWPDATVACGSTIQRTFVLDTTIAPTLSFTAGTGTGLTMISSGIWRYTYTPPNPCNATRVTETIRWDDGTGTGTLCECQQTITITDDNTNPTGDCGIVVEETTTAGAYRIRNTGTTDAINTATNQTIPPGGSIIVSVPAGGGQQCFDFQCEC